MTVEPSQVSSSQQRLRAARSVSRNQLSTTRCNERDALILVLDEPTAALNARAEVEVYRNFRDMAQGRSVLLISHRLGSARLADRIVVLDDGMIVEQGTYAELTARGGRYATMFAT